jgi:indolepyruvate ferredoxin oxidoreductase alpha subunit
MMPGMAKVRRVNVEARTAALTEYAETTPLTLVEPGSGGPGILSAGAAYQFAREVLPEAPMLKLALSWPLPPRRVAAFAAANDVLEVVEELDPYLADSIRAMGIAVGEVRVPNMGELDPGRVRHAFGVPQPETREPIEGLPPRPPMLCPGCPHRGVFSALRAMDAVATGDIGCYTLAALAPLAAMDTCVCMGASIGMGFGLSQTGAAGERPVVAVIGDSTFAHSGLTGLLNTVYNGGDVTVVILDNRTTAMTGHQGNPVSGKLLDGSEAPAIDLEATCRALGASNVIRLNPMNLKRTEKVLREETARPGVSVVIAESPCALLLKRDPDKTYAVDAALCTACGVCVGLGCPAITKEAATGKAVIDAALCVGCTQCVQVCADRAIKPSGPACVMPEGVS